MADIESSLLEPDNTLLQHILPGKQVTHKVLSNTFTTCTCLVYPTGVDPESSQEAIILRLETDKGTLEHTANMQHLASLAIPEYIPRLLQSGKFVLSDGQEVHFSVTTYVGGCIVLEKIWNKLTEPQQRHVMSQVIDAVRRLHRLDLSSGRACELLAEIGANGRATLGGPGHGYCRSFPLLLTALVKGSASKKSPGNRFSISEQDPNYPVSFNDDFDTIVRLSTEQSAALETSRKLCHNDLEPRNILVREARPNGDSKTNDLMYEVRAIIDWEMAGIYPFSYEYGLKDNVLGSSNLMCSWYAMFKSHSVPLLLAQDAQEPTQADQVSIRALHAIQRDYEADKTRNVGVCFRRKWLQRQGLVLSAPSLRGWIPTNPAMEQKVWSDEKDEALEEEVRKELGRI